MRACSWIFFLSDDRVTCVFFFFLDSTKIVWKTGWTGAKRAHFVGNGWTRAESGVARSIESHLIVPCLCLLFTLPFCLLLFFFPLLHYGPVHLSAHATAYISFDFVSSTYSKLYRERSRGEGEGENVYCLSGPSIVPMAFTLSFFF